MDIIPPSLVIAQAAYESNWGRSRFAKQANNYFGQHCYKKGCGIVPARRNPGLTFEVTHFPNQLAAIKSYIHNLDTHPNHQSLRQLRLQQRKQNKTPDGITLAAGLQHYSEQSHYTQSIRSIIRTYQLTQYDKI